MNNVYEYVCICSDHSGYYKITEGNHYFSDDKPESKYITIRSVNYRIVTFSRKKHFITIQEFRRNKLIALIS